LVVALGSWQKQILWPMKDSNHQEECGERCWVCIRSFKTKKAETNVSSQNSWGWIVAHTPFYLQISRKYKCFASSCIHMCHDIVFIQIMNLGKTICVILLSVKILIVRFEVLRNTHLLNNFAHKNTVNALINIWESFVLCLFILKL
jgi:hypothetical protein